MRFAEFFAGIGLVRMGLEKSGWKCVFANDIDPKKLEMYQAQFPDAGEHFVLGDVRSVPASHVPEIDLATASFPCTDLSLAGARAGLAGQHSSALWPFLEVLHKIEHARPRLVLLENVVGFLTSHGGADFKSALMALNNIGYEVDAFIIDAVHFVPQSRPRLFVVGRYSPESLIVRQRRQPVFLESQVRPYALARFIFDNPEIAWNIETLPALPSKKSNLAEVLEDTPADSADWWSNDRSNYLLSQMSDKHLAIANSMISSPTTTVGTVFRRVRAGRSMAELRVDGVAGCLRTPKGGSGRQILFFAGNGTFRVRLISPRECARLMGADDFRLSVPNNQALFGFGDAVCVPVIDWIARCYLNQAISVTDSELAACHR